MGASARGDCVRRLAAHAAPLPRRTRGRRARAPRAPQHARRPATRPPACARVRCRASCPRAPRGCPPAGARAGGPPTPCPRHFRAPRGQCGPWYHPISPASGSGLRRSLEPGAGGFRCRSRARRRGARSSHRARPPLAARAPDRGADRPEGSTRRAPPAPRRRARPRRTRRRAASRSHQRARGARRYARRCDAAPAFALASAAVSDRDLFATAARNACDSRDGISEHTKGRKSTDRATARGAAAARAAPVAPLEPADQAARARAPAAPATGSTPARPRCFCAPARARARAAREAPPCGASPVPRRPAPTCPRWAAAAPRPRPLSTRRRAPCAPSWRPSRSSPTGAAAGKLTDARGPSERRCWDRSGCFAVRQNAPRRERFCVRGTDRREPRPRENTRARLHRLSFAFARRARSSAGMKKPRGRWAGGARERR